MGARRKPPRGDGDQHRLAAGHLADRPVEVLGAQPDGVKRTDGPLLDIPVLAQFLVVTPAVLPASMARSAASRTPMPNTSATGVPAARVMVCGRYATSPAVSTDPCWA